MSNDYKPPNRLVEGGPHAEADGQKTRAVLRTDIIDQTIRAPASAGEGMPVEPTRQLGSLPAGAPAAPPGILGKTRLIGGGAEALPNRLAAGAGYGGGAGGTGGAGGGGAAGGGGGPAPAKTQYLRPADMKTDPVVGWLVVLKGPGRGAFKPIFAGMNSIGRDPGQRIAIDLGDDTISREEHAFITYDDEQRIFFVQHGGKSNLVRLNKAPVLTPSELKAADVIRIGKTSLRFVPLCGPDFSWDDESEED